MHNVMESLEQIELIAQMFADGGCMYATSKALRQNIEKMVAQYNVTAYYILFVFHNVGAIDDWDFAKLRKELT